METPPLKAPRLLAAAPMRRLPSPLILLSQSRLTVLNWGSDIDVKINQDAYARLNEKFPNVTVKDNFVTGTATWSEYITKLLTMIGSGNSPDMVMMAIEGFGSLSIMTW